jgi:hypothetical protein
MQASPSPFRRALGLLLALALGGPLRAQSQPLEGLLIVASTDEGPLDRDRRRKLATLATTMAHLDKGQFNPINFIPPGQPPTMFVPIAAPTGRILLYTYDDKQPDAAKREELRIGLPFNGLSYQLTPPFHRFGDPNDFHLRNLSISTTRSAGSRRWRWSPDGQRLFLVLGGDRWITSGGGAREITFTGSVPNGYLEGFAQDANHLLLYSQPPGAKPRWYTARLPERQASVDLAKTPPAASSTARMADPWPSWRQAASSRIPRCCSRAPPTTLGRYSSPRGSAAAPTPARPRLPCWARMWAGPCCGQDSPTG